MVSEAEAGSAPALSVVAPIYNEEDVIAEFVARVSEALASWPGGFELVCVDDGSTDGTVAVLASMRDTRPWLRVIRLARNYGQQMALMAGMDSARGASVVLIDADLQRPPSAIPLLMNGLDETTDIVFGTRPHRRDGWSRRVSSWLVAKLLVRLTGNRIPDCTTAFVAMRRRFVDRLRLHRSRNRVLSYLLLSLGKGCCRTVEVEHRPRPGGRSKQRVRPLLGLVLSLLAEADRGLPDLFWGLAALHAAVAVVGTVAFAMGGLGGGETAGIAALAVAAVGYVVTFVCVSFALLAHAVTRVWREVQSVPPYVAWEVPDRGAA